MKKMTTDRLTYSIIDDSEYLNEITSFNNELLNQVLTYSMSYHSEYFTGVI